MVEKNKVYITAGEIVEGKKCDIYARKSVWKGLQKEPITQKSMMLYELDRNCSVKVVEALSLNPEEMKVREEKNVHGNEGDKIQGDAIRLYVDSKRKDLNFVVKEGITSTHGGHIGTTKSRTVGKIKYPFAIYKKLLGYSASSEIINLEDKK